MTERIKQRAGDTMALDCVAYTDAAMTTPRDLTTVTVQAFMDAPFRDQIELTVVVTDPENGAFSIQATDEETALWRTTIWNAWVSYTEAGDKGSTEIFQLDVVGSYNPA